MSSFVDLNRNTVTCTTCGTQEHSADISILTPGARRSFVDNFEKQHICPESDPWKAAWARYERDNHALPVRSRLLRIVIQKRTRPISAFGSFARM